MSWVPNPRSRKGNYYGNYQDSFQNLPIQRFRQDLREFYRRVKGGRQVTSSSSFSTMDSGATCGSEALGYRTSRLVAAADRGLAMRYAVTCLSENLSQGGKWFSDRP